MLPPIIRDPQQVPIDLKLADMGTQTGATLPIHARMPLWIWQWCIRFPFSRDATQSWGL